MLRAFIAIDIPNEIRQLIARTTSQLQSVLGKSLVRWVPPENIHLTLKFLGDVAFNNIDILSSMLNIEVNKSRTFSIKVGNLGAFPNLRRPRVIWIGIEAPANLVSLQNNIETAMVKFGFPQENRPYSPHLTIGRVHQRLNTSQLLQIHDALNNRNIGSLGEFQVNEVHLIKSELKPTGAIYSHLFSAKLREPQSNVDRGDF